MEFRATASIYPAHAKLLLLLFLPRFSRHGLIQLIRRGHDRGTWVCFLWFTTRLQNTVQPWLKSCEWRRRSCSSLSLTWWISWAGLRKKKTDKILPAKEFYNWRKLILKEWMNNEWTIIITIFIYFTKCFTCCGKKKTFHVWVYLFVFLLFNGPASVKTCWFSWFLLFTPAGAPAAAAGCEGAVRTECG